MKTVITPSPLSGETSAPASKSIAHRALICAALADAPTKIVCSTSSADIDATADCLNALGAKIERTAEGFSVKPIVEFTAEAVLNCRESGSTLRFLLPIAAMSGKAVSLYGEGRLPQRPLEELVRVLSAHGAEFSSPTLPLKISGTSFGGRFEIDGGVSSQFISGLALASPLTNVENSIVIGGSIQSKPYIEMTLSAMRQFGINSDFTENTIRIPAAGKYISPGETEVEGDWSNAAFFMCAAAISDTAVKINGLTLDSQQGDRKCAEIIKNFGADVTFCGNSVTVTGGKKQPLEVDAGNIPDLVPVLAAMCCFAKGKSVFYNAARLRAKESDRLQSTAAMIDALGGRAEAGSDSLTVYGTGGLIGGTVDSFGDHRIAMAAAAAASKCESETIINGSEAVNKSFPAFFDKYSALGGKAKGRN